MILTKLDLNDLPQILELSAILHQESEYKNQPLDITRLESYFKNTLRYPDTYFLVYKKQDDKVMGFFLGCINEYFFNGEKIAMDNGMVILKEFRGKGIFSELLNEFEKWACSHKCSYINVYHTTGIEMEKAPLLFNHLGFKTKGYVFSKEL